MTWNDPSRPPLTKIISTIGPASSAPHIVAKLIQTGVSIFRVNFGHGSMDDHARRVETITSAAAELGRPVAILGDIQGPKIRVGQVAGAGIDVKPGEAAVFQREPCVTEASQNPRRFSSTFRRLIDDVQPGHRILVNDGEVRMLVTAKHHDELHCTVTSGGLITSGKGINLPDTQLSVATLGERDWEHVRWAIENDLDFLALSFVRTAKDVLDLKQGLEALMKVNGPGKRTPDRQGWAAESAHGQTARCPMQIIAKIEVPQAVENIDSILDASDGIMVARGDLGVEMDLARVPVIQKRLLAAASAFGKPCIVATQMLESMIESATPTRAEVSDVAGAIEDGADALMLSGETAVGNYPVLAVESMRRTAQYTEQYLATLPQAASPPERLVRSRYRTAALAHGAWTIAHDIGAKFIVVWSQQGGGARYLSQNNFTIPIVAITSDDRAARQMQLLRGVVPVRMPPPEDLTHFTRMIDAYLLETGWAAEGDTCLLMAGAPVGRRGATNCIAIHALGDASGGFSLHGARR